MLEKRVRANNPLIKEDPNRAKRWAKDIDKIYRIDEIDWGVIETVIDWSQDHEFWPANILSGAKLRSKFIRLTSEMYANESRDAERELKKRERKLQSGDR